MPFFRGFDIICLRLVREWSRPQIEGTERKGGRFRCRWKVDLWLTFMILNRPIAYVEVKSRYLLPVAARFVIFRMVHDRRKLMSQCDNDDIFLFFTWSVRILTCCKVIDVTGLRWRCCPTSRQLLKLFNWNYARITREWLRTCPNTGYRQNITRECHICIFRTRF